MNVLKGVKRVAVGISGGVDSAVSALLLKKSGFDVTCVYMKNWDLADEVGQCTASEDLEDAHRVSDLLSTPFKELNFIKDYWNEVFSSLLEDYENGLTPNPDLLCNKHIKFDKFLSVAVDELGADLIATGHYARNSFPGLKHCRPKLLKARDPLKDQTFFLSSIKGKALGRTVFPVGGLLKTEVKKIAVENGLLRAAARKESVGICFIGERNFREFISDYIEPSPGLFIDIDTGVVVGEHTGKHCWTLGQRCKLGGLKNKYYVAHKSVDSDIYVASGHDHPVLYSRFVLTESPSWISMEPDRLSSVGYLKCQFRFQHGEPLMDCTVIKVLGDRLSVVLDKPLRALTPGQYCVFYLGDECLGCARIKYNGPSEYVLDKSNLCDTEM